MWSGIQRLGRAPWVWALLAVLLVLAWQTLTVHANYAGDWTALFRTGRTAPVPDSLARGTFRGAHPVGYDGQFYRLLAHDPFLRHGTAAYLDAPAMRWRRIGVPLAAWALAGGQPGAIDTAYLLVILGSIFAGVRYLGLIMAGMGRPAVLGLLFLGVPAVVVAADTMTVDVALAALAAGFAWHWRRQGGEPGWGLWFTLAAAGLVRETGLLLAAGCLIAAGIRRNYRQAAFWGTAMLPALGWYGYAHLHLALPAASASASVPGWVWPVPRLGIAMLAIHPVRYPLLGAAVERLVRGLDSLALGAMMGAAALGLMRLRREKAAAIRAALALQVALMLAIMTQESFWIPAYGYARPFAPLFVWLLAGEAAGRASKAAILVCALVDLRVLAEMETQAVGVLRWLGWG